MTFRRFQMPALLLALAASFGPAGAADTTVLHGSGSFARRAAPASANLDAALADTVAAPESDLRIDADAFGSASGTCMVVHMAAGPRQDRHLCVLTTVQGDQIAFESAADQPTWARYGVTRAIIVGGTGRYRGAAGELRSYATTVDAGRGEPAMAKGRIDLTVRLAPAGERS